MLAFCFKCGFAEKGYGKAEKHQQIGIYTGKMGRLLKKWFFCGGDCCWFLKGYKGKIPKTYDTVYKAPLPFETAGLMVYIW